MSLEQSALEQSTAATSAGEQTPAPSPIVDKKTAVITRKLKKAEEAPNPNWLPDEYEGYKPYTKPDKITSANMLEDFRREQDHQDAANARDSLRKYLAEKPAKNSTNDRST